MLLMPLPLPLPLPLALPLTPPRPTLIFAIRSA